VLHCLKKKLGCYTSWPCHNPSSKLINFIFSLTYPQKYVLYKYIRKVSCDLYSSVLPCIIKIQRWNHILHWYPPTTIHLFWKTKLPLTTVRSKISSQDFNEEHKILCQIYISHTPSHRFPFRSHPIPFLNLRVAHCRLLDAHLAFHLLRRLHGTHDPSTGLPTAQEGHEAGESPHQRRQSDFTTLPPTLL
jgi:hypothetical protein